MHKFEYVCVNHIIAENPLSVFHTGKAERKEDQTSETIIRGYKVVFLMCVIKSD